MSSRITFLSAALMVPTLLLSAGCATGTTALWRAGASRRGHEEVPLGMPRPRSAVAIHLKEGFGPLEETESTWWAMCGSTTILREAALLEPGADVLVGPPEGDYEVLAHITTEEYPRDEAASDIHGSELVSVLGIGGDPFELFDVRLDPAFRGDALDRLRHYAAQLGADAVIDVFATGEMEHHMYLGLRVGLHPWSTSSPFFTNLRLLDPRLRDVRLHGTAVRRVD